MSDKSSEAAVLVRRIAGPRQATDSIKLAIYRAARRLGWSASRTRDVWYGAARRIDAEEMDALREAARTVEAEADYVLSELTAMVALAQRLLADRAREADHHTRAARSRKAKA